MGYVSQKEHSLPDKDSEVRARKIRSIIEGNAILKRRLEILDRVTELREQLRATTDPFSRKQILVKMTLLLEQGMEL